MRPTQTHRRRPTQALCGVLLAGLLLGCPPASKSPVEERSRLAREGAGELVVGVAWPWQARNELLFDAGLEMALEEINGSDGVHGRPLRLLREDDNESVNDGRLVAQRLGQNPDVMAVIGHLQSHVTVPAAAIYDLSGLLLVSPASTSSELTARGYPLVFRATFTDGDTGRAMADYALRQGYRRLAILYVRSIYGRALANAFEERLSGSAASIVARESYGSDQDAGSGVLEPMLDQWRQHEVDAIFLAGEVPSAGRLIRQMRAAGIDVPILGGDAMSSPALIDVGGPAVDGTVVATFFHPDAPRPEVRRFREAFEARHGVPPDAGAALAYDALKLLAEAMRRAPSPAPADVAEALRAMADWPGVTGNFTFNSRGDLVGRRIAKSVVQDGRFVYLDDASDAEAEAGSG